MHVFAWHEALVLVHPGCLSQRFLGNPEEGDLTGWRVGHRVRGVGSADGRRGNWQWRCRTGGVRGVRVSCVGCACVVQHVRGGTGCAAFELFEFDAQQFVVVAHCVHPHCVVLGALRLPVMALVRSPCAAITRDGSLCVAVFIC